MPDRAQMKVPRRMVLTAPVVAEENRGQHVPLGFKS